jgi:phosphatidylglycerophosphate synthase
MGENTGALVVATSVRALTVVAGVPLVVRAILELRAGGIPTVAVFAGPQDRRVAGLLADRGLAIPCLGTAEQAAGMQWPERMLVVAGDVLFDAPSLAPLLTGTGVAVGQSPGAPAGEPWVARVPGSATPGVLADLARGRGLRIEAFRGPGVPSQVVLERGLALTPARGSSPAALERALLDHLARRTSTKDSVMAALVDRRLSRPLTRLFVRSPLSPSHITLLSIGCGLLGASGLATVSYAGRLAGVLALVVSIVLDCVDGEVARARFQQSAAGARLDVIGDYLVHLAVFVGLTTGLVRQGLPPGGTWAAIGLVAGVVVATVTMHALFVRPALTGGGDLHWEGEGGLGGTPLAPFIEKLASRDYTYLLLVLALLGHLEWFLYAAAVGSWVFIVGVLGYWAYQRRAVQRRAVETV